jgi:hypothetical protein
VADEIDGGVVNEFLTAYLQMLYALRGGRLSAADAMNHVIDMASAAQRTKTAFGKLLSFGSQGSATFDAKGGRRHTSGGEERHA